MSSYADDSDSHAGDWVRCDVEGCPTPHARMDRLDGVTLHAPIGWQTVHHEIRDGSTIRTLTAHACPRCLASAHGRLPYIGARFVQ